MPELLDAIVIGAGPAGLSAAEKLAEEGFRVVVPEKEKKPNYEKLCGSYIPALVFEAFDIPKTIADYPVKGIKIVAEGNEWIVEFDDVVGYNVDRTKFAEYLASRVEKKGGEILTSTIALKVHQSDNSITVICRDKRFEARVAVAADGVYSRVGGKIRGRFKPEDLGLAIQVKCSLSKSFEESSRGLNTILLGRRFSPLGYAYAFPKKDRVDVGVGTLLTKAREANMEDYLNRAIARCGLEKVSKPRYAAVPLSGPLTKICDRRILLAGDAAGHVAPLIGEGIKFALIAGHLAAESIILYLRNHISLYELGRIYLSKLKKSFYKRFKLEKILLKMFVKRKISSAKMLSDSTMRRTIAELYTDRRELHKLVLASLLRVPVILLR